MATELHWITGPWPGKLALAARPRGGDWLEDEIAHWHHSGVDTVLSLLSPDEEPTHGLGDEADAGFVVQRGAFRIENGAGAETIAGPDALIGELALSVGLQPVGGKGDGTVAAARFLENIEAAPQSGSADVAAYEDKA